MTQREKLVELIAEGRMCPVDGNPFEEEKCLQCKYAEDKDCDLTRLADYLLENGVIVPPCKVGDTVWEIEDPFFEDDDKGPVVETKVEHFYIGTSLDLIEMEDFDTYIFFTKEEAEKALAEKENENG